MDYGSRIYALRTSKGLTQEQLAKSLEISRASLAHYEQNRREPDSTMLTKIANYFDVSVDYIIGRTNNPHTVLDNDVREFVDQLELSDEEIIAKFKLKVDGIELTAEEAKRFVAFVRAERSM
ncbi:helix-turn-helix domain-containing protein [Paenibacillus sp. J2TS4]|uniref:helix-turn-helix domain-containing protein n=1 Tax=Paenibacillus sp. J2TS4 TaxID=2807194 RepID=UPI001B203E00|nr:helix-turn-helix transcriptional regulator [Paenibacillus sp. J2TS4]GIP36214.1 transcriptional regulator [Paenibacillus sp. J2TS4]